MTMKKYMIRQYFTVMLYILFFSLFANAQEKVHAFKSITDVEGNSYKTIQVGKQEWMAENLRTTSFRDGSPITYTEQDREWYNTKKAAWCYYDDLPSYNPLYGKLYNAYVILDAKGICPSGWRIPSKKDWDDLQSFLGRNWVAAKLKSEKSLHWQSPPLANSWSRGEAAPKRIYTYIGPPTNNASGMTMLAGGFREQPGTYRKMCQEGTYWTYPMMSSSPPVYYPAVMLSYMFGGVTEREVGPNTGASIRCIKE